MQYKCARCKTTASIRKGSFFSKSNLPLRKCSNGGISCDRGSLSWEEYSHQCIPVVEGGLLTRLIGTTLRGPGKIIQIDESLFKHKPKNCNKFI